MPGPRMTDMHLDSSNYIMTSQPQRTSTAGLAESDAVSSPATNRLFTCTLCEETFLESDVILHLHIQPHVTLYDCDSCVEGFTSEDNLKQHLLYHTETMIHQNYVSNGGWLLLADLDTEMRNTDSPPTTGLQEAIQQRQRTLSLTVEPYYHKENLVIYMTQLSSSRSSHGNEEMGIMHTRNGGRDCPIRMSVKRLREGCQVSLHSTTNDVTAAVAVEVETSTTDVCDAEKAKNTRDMCVELGKAGVADKVKEQGQNVSLSLTHTVLSSDLVQDYPQHNAVVVYKNNSSAETLSQRQTLENEIVENVQCSAERITESVVSSGAEVSETSSINRSGLVASTTILDIGGQGLQEVTRSQKSDCQELVNYLMHSGKIELQGHVEGLPKAMVKEAVEELQNRLRMRKVPHRERVKGRVIRLKQRLKKSQASAVSSVSAVPPAVSSVSPVPLAGSSVSPVSLIDRDTEVDTVSSEDGDASRVKDRGLGIVKDIEKCHTCSQCGKQFTLAGILKIHMMTHTGEKPHTCLQCGKQFTLACYFTSHMLAHTEQNLKKPHACSQCRKQFQEASHLKTHMMTHTGGGPHKCSQCGKQFKVVYQLKKHMMTHTGEKPHTCSQCDKQFTEAIHLKTHMITCTGERPHKCFQCGKTFSSLGVLKAYMEMFCPAAEGSKTPGTNKESSMASPTLFDISTSGLQELPSSHQTNCKKLVNYVMRRKVGHLQCCADGLPRAVVSQAIEELQYRVKTKEMPNRDTVIGRINLLKQRLKKTYKYTETSVHTSTGTVVNNTLTPTSTSGSSKRLCKQTDNEATAKTQLTRVSKRNNLKTHMMTNTGEKAHTHSQCEKQFREAGTLEKHMMTHTRETAHICPQCGKQFKELDNLKEHLMTHTGKEPYKCSQCGKQFREAGNLNKHMMIHTGENPHECSNCGKGFKEAGHLKEHMTIHTGEKPHKCLQCGKRFRRQRDLKPHMRIHTGEKPYACSYCDKQFTHAGSLKIHMMTHTGEKPHTCLRCGKQFTQVRSLKRHMMTHTGEKPHQCAQCGKWFRAASTLRKHMMIHTGKKPHECCQCGKLFFWADQLKRHNLRRDCPIRLSVSRTQVVSSVSPVPLAMSSVSPVPPAVSSVRPVPPAMSSVNPVPPAMSSVSPVPPAVSSVHPVPPAVSSVSPVPPAMSSVHPVLPAVSSVRPVALAVSSVRPIPPVERTRSLESDCQELVNYLMRRERIDIESLVEALPRAVVTQAIEELQHKLGMKRGTHTYRVKGRIMRLQRLMRNAVSSEDGDTARVKDRGLCVVKDVEKCHTCSQCGLQFTLLGILKIHMMTHTGQKPYQCSQCGKQFAQAAILKKHMMAHTGEKPHKCSQCDKQFKVAACLKTHEGTHLEMVSPAAEVSETCSKCGKHFSSLGSFKKHMVAHRRKRPLTCVRCGKRFVWAGRLKTHMMTHTTEKSHKCSQCGKRFILVSSLQSHLKTHKQEKPHETPLHTHSDKRQKCLHCGQDFTNNMGSLVSLYGRCDVCFPQSDEKGDTAKVVRRLHNQGYYAKKKALKLIDCTEDRPHICSQCGKQFTRASDLKRHMMIHTGEKPHTCSQCGKQFTRADRLKTHMMTHRGEKPYTCSQCGKQFPWLAKLTIHMMTHTRERPHTCFQCGKQFTQAGYLKTHMMTHTGEKPYTCSQCGKQFTSANGLQCHMVVHMIETCVHCGQQFKDSTGLKSHTIIHTGQDYSSCATCVNGFTQPSDLLDHLATHIIVPALLFTYN